MPLFGKSSVERVHANPFLSGRDSVGGGMRVDPKMMISFRSLWILRFSGSAQLFSMFPMIAAAIDRIDTTSKACSTRFS